MSQDDIKKWYLDNYSKFENIVGKDALNDLREKAKTDFGSSKFPTKKDEEWKYTNISPILKHQFLPSPLAKETYKGLDNISKFKIDNLDVHLLILVNGIFRKDLSNITDLEDRVIIDSFYNQSKNNAEFLSKYISGHKDGNSFNFLNNAFTYDGFFIYVPKSTIIEKPIHILNIAGDSETRPLIQPTNIVIAEENSQVTIINEYIGDANLDYFTNAVTNISADKNSNLTFYKIQNESDSAYHIDKTEILQKDSSVVSHFSLSFGGKISRNDINSKLDGENIELHLYGLYLGKNNQHIDNHTFIDHAKPNCESNELYKGILDDNSKGVFSGKILVNQIAQKTNAFQSNKSVLLSDEASIDTKPQLEIYADDVKCSHGATVGKLDEQAFFYIRSRGVSKEAARSMLIRAFVDDVISEIKIEKLKEKVNHKIFEHLHREEF